MTATSRSPETYTTPSLSTQSSSMSSMDPLYYVVFMLALSLCCVVCVLLFWLYHQHQYAKDYDAHQSKAAQGKHHKLQMPAAMPQMHKLGTHSKATTPTHTAHSAPSRDDNSVVLEMSPIFMQSKSQSNPPTTGTAS